MSQTNLIDDYELSRDILYKHSSRDMRVTFYHSSVCPRCHLVNKHIQEIVRHNHDIEIHKIDILAQPIKTWQAGIRCIPALQINGKTLSGLYLRKEKILQFIEKYRS